MISKAQRILHLREAVGIIVGLLTGRSIPVRQEGSKAHVAYHPKTMEVKHIQIPSIPDNASDEFITSIQGFLDHEVAHVLFTTPAVLIEATRLKIANLHNMVEDCFIERKMAEAFFGSGANLASMRQIFLDIYTEPELRKIGNAGTAAQYWRVLCICVYRSWSEQSIFTDFMNDGDKWSLISEITSKIEHLKPRFKAVQDSWDALKLAQDIAAILYSKDESENEEGEDDEPKPKEEKGPEESDDEESDSEGDDQGDQSESEESEGESDDEEGGSGDEEGEEESESESESEGEGGPSDGEPDDEEEPSEQSGKGGAPLSAEDMDDLPDYDDVLSDAVEFQANRENAKADYTVFSRDADLIIPVKVGRSEDCTHTIGKMDANVKQHIGGMTRKMEQIFRSKNKSYYEGGLRRGKLHSAALSRLAADSDNVFRKKIDMKTRDVSVSLVIDCSGSMMMSRIGLASEVAWACSEVLDKLKVDHEIIGYTTMSRDAYLDKITDDPALLKKLRHHFGQHERAKFTRSEPLYMPIFKGFDERFTNVTKTRLAKANGRHLHMEQNTDGESLLYALDRLQRRKNRGKAMIVLSDGKPAMTSYDRGAAHQHLKKVCKDIEASDVDLFGIGIQSEDVKMYYKHHAVVQTLDDLPTIVLGAMQRAIFQK